jgi:hypothetical protein
MLEEKAMNHSRLFHLLLTSGLKSDHVLMPGHCNLLLGW